MEVIGVRFRGGPKEYYFDPHGVTVEPGRFVIVETAQGTEYAQCVTGNHEVEDGAVVQPLRPLVRLATENDRRTWEYNKSREKEAFDVCLKKIADHGLDMKLVRVESNFDGSKILFFFTSDGRVDFRELVRDLAGVFRARIELRQIGVRDEAKMLGGLGICGRPFCCAEFLEDFNSVSIKMAKTQNLSLNPTKISGTCGRLMCCLKYEQEAYEDAARRCPKQDSFVLTPDGPGNVSAVDLLREQVTVRLDDQSDKPARYRTGEIVVLRNGKGSREGIAVPAERPARIRPEQPEAEAETDERPALSAAEQIVPDEGPAEEKRSSRSRRGGRGRRRGGEKAQRTEGAAERQAQEAHAEKKSARPEHGEKAGAKGERKQPDKGGKKPADPAAPKPPKGERSAKHEDAAVPGAAAPAEDGKSGARRRRHRGGRGRRSGSGGEKTEA